MICPFCKYEFDDNCGLYGCPNCLSEGLDEGNTMEHHNPMINKIIEIAAEKGCTFKLYDPDAGTWESCTKDQALGDIYGADDSRIAISKDGKYEGWIYFIQHNGARLYEDVIDYTVDGLAAEIVENAEVQELGELERNAV
jgi:hypothetical protein